MSADPHQTTLLVLYPLFKEEVYRRREQILRWTATAAGSLFAIVSGLLLIPEAGRLSAGERMVLAGAILLLAGTFVSLILQQQQRHRQAKQTLIDLEQALGLYERDLFLHQRALYPDRWKTDWTYDPFTTISFALIGLFALLAIAATFLVR